MTRRQPARGRGRPRPRSVVARDQRVLELLAARPRTRAEIVAALGYQKQHVYLSLRRLALAGRVARASGADRPRTNVWMIVPDEGAPSQGEAT